jgi:hypothetical protein
MTFLPDGAPFTYGDAPEPDMIAIGWLDASEPFTTGSVPSEFVERLRILCRDHEVNRTRGWHYCNLCPPSPGPELPRPVAVDSPEGEFYVGHSEIRVVGPSGTRYAAPQMIIHYVETHEYKPPDDFIAGVLTGQPATQ